MGYRVVRQDSQGIPWILSVASHGMREVEVQGGETVEIDLPEEVALSFEANRARGAARLQVGIRTTDRAGASLYRDGRRIELEYRVEDGGGRSLATGTLEYG